MENFLFFLNIRSLRCHHDQLEVFIKTLNPKPKIIALCETWLTDNDPIEVYAIENYQKIEIKNRQNKRGGGVALYILDDYDYEIIDTTNVENCDFLSINFFDKKTSISVTVGYRAPDSNKKKFLEHFETYLEQICIGKQEKIICGDFNIDTLVENEFAKKYQNVLSSFGLSICNDTPTRVTKNSKTCIDHTISSVFLDTRTVDCDISDHSAVEIELPLSNLKQNEITNQEIVSFDYSKLYKNDNLCKLLFLLLQSLKFINDQDSTDNKLTFLTNSITRLCSKFLIKNCRKKKSSKTWITHECIKVEKNKQKAFKKWKNCPTKEHWELYAKSRNLAVKTFKNAKISYNDKSNVPLQNSKTIFSALKKFINPNSRLISTIKAESFNNFFSTVGARLARECGSTDKVFRPSYNEKTFIFSSITTHEVSKALKLIKSSSSCGHDGISNKLLKMLLPVISEPLAQIFNECIELNYFPEQLKIARIIPLYKEGNRKLVNNYRPISLLPSIDKVFEKIIYKRMISFIDKYKLINEQQFGFQKNKSCIHAILSFTEEMRKQLDNKEGGTSVFVDLKKAFDTIDRKILLKKLQIYGFRGNFLLFLESYLKDRKQFVDYNNEYSSLKLVDIGVPQGSVLGPLLFLLYINDLPLVLKNGNAVLFADDTTIVSSSKGPKFQQDLNNVQEWLKANKLTLNCEKSVVMNFGRCAINNIELSDKKLKLMKHCKYLGIYVDKDLKFKEHIQKIEKKLAKFSGLIFKVRDYFSKKQLLLFYNAYAKSVIDYGILVYGKALKTDIDKINKMQKRIIRTIYRRKKFSPTQDIFEDNLIFNVNELYCASLIREMLNQIRGKSPMKSINFSTQNGSSRIITRGARKGLQPIKFHRTSFMHNSVTRDLVTAFNLLKGNDLIPSNLHEFNESEFNVFWHKLKQNFIFDNHDLIKTFFK